MINIMYFLSVCTGVIALYCLFKYFATDICTCINDKMEILAKEQKDRSLHYIRFLEDRIYSVETNMLFRLQRKIRNSLPSGSRYN